MRLRSRLGQPNPTLMRLATNLDPIQSWEPHTFSLFHHLGRPNENARSDPSIYHWFTQVRYRVIGKTLEHGNNRTNSYRLKHDPPLPGETPGVPGLLQAKLCSVALLAVPLHRPALNRALPRIPGALHMNEQIGQ